MAKPLIDALCASFDATASTPAPTLLAATLRRSLLGLDVPEGTRLCSLVDLVERTGLSLGVVREAVQQLQSAGLIEVRQGALGGIFVRRVQQVDLVTTLDALVQSNQVPREAVAEVRAELEALCGRLAARHATSEGMQDLRACAEHMATLVDNPLAFAEENMKFHFLISKATGNPVLIYLTGALRDLFFSSSVGVKYAPETLQKAVHAHTRIVEAIEARDADRVSDAILGHANALELVMRDAESADGLSVPPAGASVQAGSAL